MTVSMKIAVNICLIFRSGFARFSPITCCGISDCCIVVEIVLIKNKNKPSKSTKQITHLVCFVFFQF